MLRFDGKVALITGAGGGIGRAYALLLASRGAKVLVNDLGGQVDGSSPSAGPARAVVKEIVTAGGQAVADDHSIATARGGAAAVDRALAEFGRIDVVIHNAGIVDRAKFVDQTAQRLRDMLDVHLAGAFNVLHPAWRHLQAQGYGRVVLTASHTGFFGLDQNSTYGAAKMGLVGLVRTLAIEGQPHQIRVNAIAPLAATRMARSFPATLAPRIDPALVAAAVAVLAHEDCPISGRVLAAGGGRVSELFLAATRGFYADALTPELVLDHLDQVLDKQDYELPTSALDAANAMFGHLGGLGLRDT